MTDCTLASLFERYPALLPLRGDIERAVEMMIQCYRRGGKALACGNGGSAADAEHIVGELMKGFLRKRPISAAFREKIEACFPGEGAGICASLQTPLTAIALTSHVALSTAFNNDVNPEFTFAQQLLGLGRQGDVLIALSTSGNSRNVVNACKIAKVMGIETIAMTGASGGALKRMCDVTLCAPSSETFVIQEYHLPIYHALCYLVEAGFFRE
ncbi:MAG: SIS domain-containing protein [Verrucomicrobiae bacterium]|nr:SIS domain-containing protein [Verrucomicrobiae bacterium]